MERVVGELVGALALGLQVLDGEQFEPHIDSMNRFCINRHHQAINGIFLDQSVHKVWLKQLWRVKWGRNFDVTWPEPDWASEAPWMIAFKGG